MAGQQDDSEAANTGYYNWKMPTLGGKQVWTDHRWWYGWRVQENLLTGHWRLIDSRNVRHAWGTRQACDLQLDRIIKSEPPREAPEKVVILMHGLMRSSDSMNPLAQHLQNNGFPVVVSFGYGSTRSSISNHAQALREVVDQLPGSPRLYFSCHSMGNIVLRHAIGDWQTAGDQATLQRLESIVMLGPPNHGAAIARRLAKTGLFGVVTGKAGMELGPAWNELEEKLAIPPCRFGIVMGDLEWSHVNPLVDGPSDLIVSKEEAELEGAAETLSVNELHSFLMNDVEVQKGIVRFFNGQHLAAHAGESEPGTTSANDRP